MLCSTKLAMHATRHRPEWSSSSSFLRFWCFFVRRITIMRVVSIARVVRIVMIEIEATLTTYPNL